jgi:hypothetical protein
MALKNASLSEKLLILNPLNIWNGKASSRTALLQEDGR